MKNIKNKKKKNIKVRDISNDKEIRIMIWLLFAIGIVLWGCYEVVSTENAVSPTCELLLTEKGNDKILDEYKDDPYFKAAFKEYKEDIATLKGQIDIKNEDSDEYDDLIIQKEYLEDNIVRYSLYGMKHHYLMEKSFKSILLISILYLLIFSVSFILITLKKFKIFNIITIIEVLLIFIFEFIYGDFIDVITSMEFNMIQSVRFLSMLFPIILNYLYSLYYKKDV